MFWSIICSRRCSIFRRSNDYVRGSFIPSSSHIYCLASHAIPPHIIVASTHTSPAHHSSSSSSCFARPCILACRCLKASASPPARLFPAGGPALFIGTLPLSRAPSVAAGGLFRTGLLLGGAGGVGFAVLATPLAIGAGGASRCCGGARGGGAGAAAGSSSFRYADGTQPSVAAGVSFWASHQPVKRVSIMLLKADLKT